ncbi:DUF3088 family protein [Xanthomonas arboricola]|uniref:DUF3088 family protein n=1 Tax=Xanthomonas arboricola TaxID=56448 RepID=UPI00141B97D6|nr:DUF3088 family protein [Xanthomonas arboricola]NIK52091.1 hypothetical protein [Xanthomonas arboricola]
MSAAICAAAVTRLDTPASTAIDASAQRGRHRHVRFVHLRAVRGRLEMRRIGFPRPRRDVIGLVGESDRSLPTLVTCSARCAGSAIAANHPSEGMAELRR